MAIAGTVLMVLGAVVFADFLSGLAHWLEDSCFTPSTPLLGPTIAKNVLHHRQPALFVSNPWSVTIRSSLVCAAIVEMSLGISGRLNWWTGTALLIAIFANQIHKWAHMTDSAVPRVGRWLRRWHITQTATHHAFHHLELRTAFDRNPAVSFTFDGECR